MRQNVVIVLLSVCLSLLAVNLCMLLARSQPIAIGQGVGVPTGSVAIASVQGNDQSPWCFVYDVTSQRIAVYKAGNQGLELKGVRQITYDIRLEELDKKAANMNVRVADVKKLKGGSTPAPAPKGKVVEEPEETVEEGQ